MLINFISNAIKYSPNADRVIISSRTEGDLLTVCVQDFGIGIESDNQARVFDRFFRAGGAVVNTFPGLGLGLYISAQIIRRQGGTIHMTSKNGAGSTFCFTLPVHQPVST